MGGGGQNILRPPHIFEWGGGGPIPLAPAAPPPPSDAPTYLPIGTYEIGHMCIMMTYMST